MILDRAREIESSTINIIFSYSEFADELRTQKSVASVARRDEAQPFH